MCDSVPAFVMYCVNEASRSSLLIESTDSMIYLLGAKYGFVQSTNCVAQTTDPYFARQSMDFVHNPWIVSHILLILMSCDMYTPYVGFAGILLDI